MPFIRAISETSPTSQLYVTFLRTCAIEPNDAGHSRGKRTAAYSSRSVGICVMLAGSIPVKRFSPNNLPGRHQGQAAADTKTEHGRRTEWQLMASRKQRRGTGPSANSV